MLDSEEEGNETAGDAGIGFFDPIVRLVFYRRISCGTGPSYGTAGCGAYSCPSRNASTPRDGFLERPDRGPQFVLSRWRPAAPWRELGGVSVYDDHPFIVLTETKFSLRCIPVWVRYSPHRTRVEKKKHMR